MEHFILHFLTGTMAFRVPRTSRRRKGAEIPDAFLEKYSYGKNQNAGKAAKSARYARIMQDGTVTGSRQNHANGWRQKYTGRETDFGERLGGAKEKSGKVTQDATTAKQSRAGSTAMQRKYGIGGRAEYHACGAISRGDEESHALAAGI